MLSLLPVRKSLAALDGRFATNTLMPAFWRGADDPPLPVSFRTCSGTESRLPRDREDPCSFRTRLIDPVAHAAADPVPAMDVEGADIPDDSDLKFDDTQCISIGRSTSNVKSASGTPTFSSHGRDEGKTHDGGIARGLTPRLHSTPAVAISAADDELGPAEVPSYSTGIPAIYKAPIDQTNPCRAVSINEIDNDDASDNEEAMETVSMPFWNIPRREKRHSVHSTSDTIPDDMSIISDASLVPTYFPSDVAKRQQQQRPQHGALIRRLFRVKARAARQTMRELKRSCRDAVGTVFVEASTPRAPKCVAVGSTP